MTAITSGIGDNSGVNQHWHRPKVLRADPQEPRPTPRISPRALTTAWSLFLIILGGLAGGLLGYVASIQTQESQEAEFRAAEDRELRREAYLTYLESATTYSRAVSAALGDFRETYDPDDPDGDFTAVFDPVWPTREAYQAAINRLYVFGSDEAWERHEVMAGVLPPAIGDLDLFINDFMVYDVGVEGFNDAYRGFLDVMCDELPASPRSGCRPL